MATFLERGRWKVLEKIFDPVKCKSKQFYELLISKKTMVSMGFTKRMIQLFPRPLLIWRLHIWSRQHCAKSPDFDVFKEMVDIKYHTEKCIASKNNMERNVFLMRMFSCNSFSCLWKQVALLLQRLINWCWWNECPWWKEWDKLNFVNYETTDV